jgi:hypothetical protein
MAAARRSLARRYSAETLSRLTALLAPIAFSLHARSAKNVPLQVIE